MKSASLRQWLSSGVLAATVCLGGPGVFTASAETVIQPATAESPQKPANVLIAPRSIVIKSNQSEAPNRFQIPGTPVGLPRIAASRKQVIQETSPTVPKAPAAFQPTRSRRPSPAATPEANQNFELPLLKTEVHTEYRAKVYAPEIPTVDIAAAPQVTAAGISTPQVDITPVPDVEPQPTITPQASPLTPCFRGFCPVTLRDEHRLELAHGTWASTANGVRYEFSSAEAKATFDCDPYTYIPVAGGSDLVLLKEGGVTVPGSITYAHWFRGRLFLFNSADSARKFVSGPTKYYR